MTGDYDLSADIMQESFTRYMEHYGAGNPNASLLFTIARNLFFDTIRKRKHQQEIETAIDEEHPNQEKTLLIKEEYQRTMAALLKLAPDERDLLSLVATGDLTYRQMSGITGLSEANVKVKVHRARLKLRNFLRKGDQQWTS